MYSKQEALSFYRDSNFLDCRINAYLASSDLNPIEHTIDLILMDLDLSNFKNNYQSLALGQKKIVSRIREIFYLPQSYSPSIIWSGNGNHLYVPTESSVILEDNKELFGSYKDPSKLFLRYAEYYLSNKKSDSEHYHNVSFKNCLLRIPGSYNSKNMQQVKILTKWDNVTKLKLSILYSRFLAYLIDQKDRVLKVNENENDNSGSFFVRKCKEGVLVTKESSLFEKI